MENLYALIQKQFTERGLSLLAADLVTTGILMTIVVVVAIVANFVSKRLLLRALTVFIAKTETKWDDLLIQHRVFDRLSHMVPAMVIYSSASLAFPTSPGLQGVVRQAAVAYMILFAAIATAGFIDALAGIWSTSRVGTSRPVPTSYIQIIKVVVFSISAILIIATLTNQSATGLLGGLGAFAAVLMLVFKDTILGLVASIQVSAHDMVRRGDWIEMPKYGADGDVMEVTLNTVKIRNFDKTISTIPTYSLVSETFKNWRGMSESGGRRIKRALFLDMTYTKFCDEAMMARFEKIDVLRDYMKEKRSELAADNEKRGAAPDLSLNQRNLTNLGTFRAYVLHYLRNHPKIHKEMTLLVRQLAPGPNGIAIELYCFSNDQVWSNYEDLQSDIFDHLLAVLPTFELRVFQNPSGEDVRALVRQSTPSAAATS